MTTAGKPGPMTLDDLRPPPVATMPVKLYPIQPESRAWDIYYAAIVGSLLREEDTVQPEFLSRAALLADGMLEERRKRFGMTR